MKLFLNKETNVLHDGEDRVFDRMARRWRIAAPSATGGEEITIQDACRWLQRQDDYPIRSPISLIGQTEASEAQMAIAQALGTGIAKLGLSLLCDGGPGVATAAAQGAQEADGQVIGILPGTDWRDASPYVSVSLAAGASSRPNTLIAEAGLCLIAIGGGYETLGGIAHGKQCGRKVFTMGGAPTIEGVPEVDGIEEALDAISHVALNTDGAEPTWR